MWKIYGKTNERRGQGVGIPITVKQKHPLGFQVSKLASVSCECLAIANNLICALCRKKKVNAVNFLSVATGAIVYRTQTFAKKVDYRSVASIISCCANLELSVPPLHVASAKY